MSELVSGPLPSPPKSFNDPVSGPLPPPPEFLNDPNPPSSEGPSFNAQSNSSNEKDGSLAPRLATGDPYLHEPPRDHTSAPSSEAWSALVNVGRAHDKDVCSTWKGEIDNLLIFVRVLNLCRPTSKVTITQASLFSAVVTSFIIESYKLLSVDHQELASTVLLRMHNQLDSILRQGTSIPPLVPDPIPQFTPSRSAVAINACFFLSLMLSLSAVSVGILCLQWLQQYGREPDVSLKYIIAIRHFRLRGLEDWWVAEIIGLLPLVFQASLFLFYIGVAVFLLNTNETVAIPVCCLIGITVLILVATSIIPAFHAVYAKWDNTDEDHSMCPYRSPQAWVTRRGFLAAILGITSLLNLIGSALSRGLLHAARLRHPKTEPDPEVRSENTTDETTQAGDVLSGWLSKIVQQFDHRFKSKDWLADDVRHVTPAPAKSRSSGPAQSTSPRPTAKSPTPQSTTGSPTQQPTAEAPTQQPTAESPTQQPTAKSPIPQPPPGRWYKGVAWELASVPRTHLHNVEALCAFIRCIGDMNPDQWALMLKGILDKKSLDSDLVKMLEKTPSSPKNAPGCVMGQNLTLASTLDYLADRNV
ncbi:hypothetical protein H1R20_g8875, partial [Candolleomyces eurysporus]